MKEKFKCVYVLNRNETQFKALTYSLKSLTRFVRRDAIVIFYVSPVNPAHLKVLKRYDLRIVPGIYKQQEFIYLTMNRLYLATLNASNVVYFDNDTEIIASPLRLFRDDFDVAGRICGEGEWKHLGAQFVLFKNGTHKKVGRCWKRYFNKLMKEGKLGIYDEISLYRAIIRLKLNLKELPKNTIAGYQIPDNRRAANTCVIHHAKDFYDTISSKKKD